MALKTGLNAQFGFKSESTYGTAVTPDVFIDFISESMTREIQRVESSAIRAGARVQRSEDWELGTEKCSGDIELEVWNVSFGEIFQLCFGGNSTSGTADPYTHTITPGDLPSATFEFGIPAVDGTVHKFLYSGVMVDNFELSAAVGDPLLLKMGVVAKSEVSSGSVTSASYASAPEILTFVGGSVSVSGTSVPVKSFSLAGNNGLNSDRYFLGARTMSQPLEAGLREFTGSIEPEFTNQTLYGIYTAGTEVTLIANFAAINHATPAHGLTITANVRLEGTTPTVSGTDAVMNPMTYKVIDTGSTSISLAYATSDSAP